MNINTEDLEAFVAEAELINQKVKALAFEFCQKILVQKILAI